jgi:hypothetical protein
MPLLRTIVDQIDVLIFPPTERPPGYRIFIVLALAGLYALGVLMWLALYNQGEVALSAFDWRQQRVYYGVTQDALRTGQIPFFMTGEQQTTNRFLGIPETSLFPHVLLLSSMTLPGFAQFETLFFYTIGFIGCLLLMRRFRLSLLPFAALFLLFNFNGYITAHLAIGHVMWNAYFLLPFFLLLVFELVSDEATIRTALKLALVLFGIVLQGGFHIYTWCLLFLLILIAFNLSQRRIVTLTLLTIAASLLASAFRFVPAAITFGGQDRLYLTGYATLADLFGALTQIRDYDYVSQFAPRTADLLYGAGWWEFDTFIGLVGLAFVLVFGIGLRFRKDAALADLAFARLDAPLIGLFALSLSDFYRPIRALPVPLIQGERIPARFLILPLILLLVLACARAERLLPRLGGSVRGKLLAILGVAQIGLALRRHLLVWQINGIEAIFPDPGPVTATVQAISLSALSPGDRLYVTSAIVSGVVSLAALLAGVGWYVAARSRPVEGADHPAG